MNEQPASSSVAKRKRPTNRMTPDEQTYQVRTHLRFELTWLIFAADASQRADDGSYVAFLDSATVHARNLFEFAGKKAPAQFTLHALGGRAVKSDAWNRWANNRVTHMLGREVDKAPWPVPGGWDRRDKLMTLAKAVLDRLRGGCEPMPLGSVREWYEKVLSAAECYWADPTEANHQALACLHDGSRDGAYPTL